MYDKNIYLNGKRGSLVPCICDYCDTHFMSSRRKLYTTSKNKNDLIFCNALCMGLFYRNRVIVECSQCNKSFEKYPNQISKTKNNFCSKSCAATYNNTHKTKGNRRSKLEKWLEEQLTVLFPDLEILYSDKTTINSELDIYIPSLKLAFELNGIFHYEPIYGEDKLSQIKNNDGRKFQACIENGIELCIIDTSQHKYVKPSTSQKYLDIIFTIISSKA